MLWETADASTLTLKYLSQRLTHTQKKLTRVPHILLRFSVGPLQHPASEMDSQRFPAFIARASSLGVPFAEPLMDSHGNRKWIMEACPNGWLFEGTKQLLLHSCIFTKAYSYCKGDRFENQPLVS